MTNQGVVNERRQKGRYGVLERVENITYTILRTHGIETSKQSEMLEPQLTSGGEEVLRDFLRKLTPGEPTQIDDQTSTKEHAAIHLRKCRSFGESQGSCGLVELIGTYAAIPQER